MTCTCAKGRRCLACMERDGLTTPTTTHKRIFDLWYSKASLTTRLRYWTELAASRRRNAEAVSPNGAAEAS